MRECLQEAITVSELAAMSPSAGAFYVYARRAFGPGAGFLVGWIDDPASGLCAATLVALSAPCYWWASRRLSARAH